MCPPEHLGLSSTTLGVINKAQAGINRSGESVSSRTESHFGRLSSTTVVSCFLTCSSYTDCRATYSIVKSVHVHNTVHVAFRLLVYQVCRIIEYRIRRRLLKVWPSHDSLRVIGVRKCKAADDSCALVTSTVHQYTIYMYMQA